MDWVVLFPDPHAACCVEGHYVVVHLNATPICNLQRKKMTLNNLLQVVPWPLGLVSWSGWCWGYGWLSLWLWVFINLFWYPETCVRGNFLVVAFCCFLCVSIFPDFYIFAELVFFIV